jgi:hypothetical protein
MSTTSALRWIFQSHSGSVWRLNMKSPRPCQVRLDIFVGKWEVAVKVAHCSRCDLDVTNNGRICAVASRVAPRPMALLVTDAQYKRSGI